MSVQEIKRAIEPLLPEQVDELAQWLEELRARQWDAQIEADSKAGRFNALIEEAKVEATAGCCKPL